MRSANHTPPFYSGKTQAAHQSAASLRTLNGAVNPPFSEILNESHFGERRSCSSGFKGKFNENTEAIYTNLDRAILARKARHRNLSELPAVAPRRPQRSLQHRPVALDDMAQAPAGASVRWRMGWRTLCDDACVGLLALLAVPPLDVGPRRLVVMLSAWDKASGEGKKPAQFVEEKLPLLNQYLHENSDMWDFSIYGVSAQGGDYDKSDAVALSSAEAKALREVDKPSERIQLVREDESSHDLTEPIKWLIS